MEQEILKTGKDEFVNIMDNMPETTCILICESEVDKRSKSIQVDKKEWLYWRIFKKESNRKSSSALDCSFAWKGKKKQIRENDAIYFLQKVGDDMFQIKNETDKLIAYIVGEKEEITRRY